MGKPEYREDGQLDPFAFPSETRGRFLMLMVAALAMGADLGYFLLDAVSQRPEPAAMVRSFASNGNFPRQRSLPSFSPQELRQAGQRGLESFNLALWSKIGHLAFPLISMTLVAGVAYIIYYRHSDAIRRKYATKALTKLNAPMVVADLENWATRCGVSLPRLEYREGLAQGHAFGIRGQEVLLLHGTPEILENSWGEGPRAIALHELAHIVNGDAGEREKAKALWTALLFLLFAELSVLVLLAGPRNLWAKALSSVAMLVVIRAIWAGMIRVREYYADWRVSSWGATNALAQVLDLPSDNRRPWEHWELWWQAWRRWGDYTWWRIATRFCGVLWRNVEWMFRLHPTFKDRKKLLSRSNLLFCIPTDISVLSGFLLALILAGLFRLVMDFVGFTEIAAHYFYSHGLRAIAKIQDVHDRSLLVALAGIARVFIVPLIAASIFLLMLASLIARSIGVQVQRRAVLHLIARDGTWGYLGLMVPAVLFAMGMEIGFFLSPFSPLSERSFQTLLMMPLWLTGSTFLTWLWFCYIHGVSRLAIGSFVGREIPSKRQASVQLSAVVLLTVLYWPMALSRLTIQTIGLLNIASAVPLYDIQLRRIFYYYFLSFTMAALFFAVVAFVVWVPVTLIAIGVGIGKCSRCPSCRCESPYWINFGRFCRECGSNLTPWAFKSKPGQSFLWG